MTHKRAKKLLMALGHSRNWAEYILKCCNKYGNLDAVCGSVEYKTLWGVIENQHITNHKWFTDIVGGENG